MSGSAKKGNEVAVSAFEYLHVEIMKDLFHPRSGVTFDEALVRV